ncbi:MAG: serine hydrolase [Bryobacteraceae bacterium]
MRSALAFAALLNAGLLQAADHTVASLLEGKLVAALQRFDEKFAGALGVAAIDLETGRAFSVNGDVVFPQASSIKIPILIRMFQAERAGEFRFSDTVTLTEKDIAGGSGHLRNAILKGPVALSILELVTAMMETSDNTATNKCIEMVRMERVNRTLDELGFVSTRLRRRMMDAEAVARSEENISTPLEMARLVERLYRGRIIDERASAGMIEIMKKVKGGMSAGVPKGTATASKTGGVPGVSCETGIVYLTRRPFVLSVMSTYIGEGQSPVEAVTRIVYAHFEKLARANRYGHRISQ